MFILVVCILVCVLVLFVLVFSLFIVQENLKSSLKELETLSHKQNFICMGIKGAHKSSVFLSDYSYGYKDVPIKEVLQFVIDKYKLEATAEYKNQPTGRSIVVETTNEKL